MAELAGQQKDAHNIISQTRIAKLRH